MFRRRLRLPAVLGVCLLVAASAATLSAPADAESVDDPSVQVIIDSFGPVAPKVGQDVVIKGRVTNTSSVTFDNPQALACIDRTQLSSTAALDRISTEQNIPMDKRDSCSNLTNDSQTFQPFDQPLAPKQTVAFSLTVPWNEWHIRSETGVYVVGVTFRGGAGTDGGRVMAGRARTLMPVLGKEPLTRKVNTALVIPLRHRPTQLGGRNFVDESLARAIAPTGSLGRLLALGKQHKVTWLVDPAMLDEIRQLAKGYGILGQSAPGSGQAAATSWLKEFEAVQAKGDQVVLLPYGDPDVAGLLDSGAPLKDLVGEARKKTEQSGGEQAKSFTNGLLLEGGAAAGRYLGAASGGFTGSTPDDLNLVTSSSWSAATRPVLTSTPVYNVLTPGPDRLVRTVIADSELTNGGPDPETADSPLQVRQRFAAVTALIAADGTGPASVVALPPRSWDADGSATAAIAAGLSTLPWITPTNLSTIVAGNPKPRSTKPPAAPLTNGVLSEAQLEGVKQLDSATTTMQKLLVDGSQLPEVMTQALLRSTSAAWAGHPEEAQYFTTIELGSANQQLGKVHLVNASVDRGLRKEIKVNLAGSKGTFPLTVTNDTDWSVRVGIEVAPVNRSDLKIKRPQTAVLAPGQKWTPRITASAEQNGLIRATAQVTNADGQPVGKSQELLIQASQYGSVGWILVAVACALLFGTSFVRIYRRIRNERRNPAPAAESDSESVSKSDSEDTGDESPDQAHDRPQATDVPEQTPGTSLKEGVGSKDG